jgi:hypothetical protein
MPFYRKAILFYFVLWVVKQPLLASGHNLGRAILALLIDSQVVMRARQRDVRAAVFEPSERIFRETMREAISERVFVQDGIPADLTQVRPLVPYRYKKLAH